MNCANQMLYTIQDGDILYHLAHRFNTTVEDIITHNTYLNPHNLIAGTQILICLNSSSSNMSTSSAINPQELKLREDMNTLWEQHVFWTRLLLISIAENLADLNYTQKRLLRNPVDIGNVFREYYGSDVGNKVSELLTEHLVIGAKLITALKNGNTTLASTLTRQWYRNADDMAEAFSSFNPYYNKEDVREMLYTHLKLTTAEVAARISKNYMADIEAFDKVEKEALEMARYFAIGIVKQFPDMFN